MSPSAMSPSFTGRPDHPARRPLTRGVVATVLFSCFSAALAASVGMAPPAGAHTETDLVAVPAGSAATVSLRPTHGCEGSPTVEVAIRAPLAGATAGEVAGWTATATPTSEGFTVLEWKGGSLPADEAALFPVSFTTPAEVGRLLVFPAVQVCEDGSELSWIDGDPQGDYPAPRVLILAEGSPPAASIDDVPADAPGRDQLILVIDVDNPSGTTAPATTTSTTPAPSTGPTSSAPSPADDADGADDADAGPGTSEPGDEGSGEGDGLSPLLVLGIVAVGAGVGAGAFTLWRRSNRPQGTDPKA